MGRPGRAAAEKKESFRKTAFAARGIADDPSRHKIVIVFSFERYSKTASALRRCLTQLTPDWSRASHVDKRFEIYAALLASRGEEQMTENASETAGPAGVPLSSGKLAQMIDISAVQAFHTEDDIRSLANLALKSGFIAAHALPHFVPLLRSLIPVGSSTLVGGPIGFPSGGHTTMIKLAEARSLVEAGADELDMMINLGRLKSGDLATSETRSRPSSKLSHPFR